MDLKNLIKPKNSLLQKQIYSKIFKELFVELSSYENFQQLKDDLEYLVLCCNMLELLVDSQRKHFKALTLDKKLLVCNLYKSLFSLTDEDIAVLEERIQFIYDNNMIKKVSLSRLLKKKCSKLVLDTFSLL